MIDLTFDSEEIRRQMERLQKVPYATQRALLPTVGEVLGLARTSLAARLKSDVPLPPRLIEKSIKLSAATARGQQTEGHLTVSGKAAPLIHYGVAPREVTARKGMRPKQWPGFSYALRSGERRQRERLVGRFSAGLPFIARMPGGHLGVYYETAFGQMKEAYGPSVQYHAAAPEVERQILAGAESDFARLLPRVVDRVLAEHGAG